MSFTKKIYAGALALLITSPLVSLADGFAVGATLVDTLDNIRTFINGTLVPFVIGIAVLVFIFGIFKFITAGGDEGELKTARNTIIWGVVIIAVMLSVWGLVALVANTFGLNKSENAKTEIPDVIPVTK